MRSARHRRAAGRLAAATLAILAAACGGGTPAPPASAAATTPASPGGIGALGRIEPGEGVVRIAARSLSGQASIVARLQVGEGDRVRAGQPIAELDSRPQLEAAARQAAADVAVAERRLAQVQAGAKPTDIAAATAEVARLRVSLELAQKEHARHASLGANVTAIELDRLRLGVDAATRAVQVAEARLASVREVRDLDVTLARAELERASSSEARARAELAASIIYAPVAGRVIAIRARPGEIVGADGLMDLSPDGPMYAVAEVAEADVGRVKAGQRATVSGEGLPGTLTGTVERVGTQIIERRLRPVDPARFSDARIVEVRVRLDNADAVAHLIHLRVEVVIQP